MGGILDLMFSYPLFSLFRHFFWFIILLPLISFIALTEDCEEQRMDCNAPQWVALAVVQSYNPRRKVPRSNISVPDLECCLSKASFLAAQKSGIYLL